MNTSNKIDINEVLSEEQLGILKESMNDESDDDADIRKSQITNDDENEAINYSPEEFPTIELLKNTWNKK